MDSSLNEKWIYEDPDGPDRGILLSNQIDKLCKEQLLISENYKQGNLRPASYTLRVGDPFVDSDGIKRCLTDKNDSIIFKKNSIVFVSTKKRLRLPFYIIARFNLRVNWVYDGILLGTGPQVDPGFEGFLSCPLYNLTDGDIIIKRGDDFATIDFEKTTALLPNRPLNEKKELISNAQNKGLVHDGDDVYSFYKAPPLQPLGTSKTRKILSSLFEIREEVRNWRQIGIGSVIAFFGLTLSLLAFGANLYRQNSDLTRQSNDLSRQNTDLSRQNSDLSRQVTDGKNDLQRAIDRISSLEKRVDRLSGPSKPPGPP